ncbi:MAG: SDR family NAD(P)-dependent oxidoreductase, partial [Bdellovibrionales bacterium]|nr:SDR family NAD(P)-dependent oxidoreductase [Bdellovibrionales bacterium]
KRLEEVQENLRCQGTDTSLYLHDAAAETLPSSLQALLELKIDRIICFTGGGPYGDFDAKDWKDHQWALQVSLHFPLQLAHVSFANPYIRQWIFVGSAVAESKGDPQASSYAAAKHGLKGWFESVRQESQRDIRLFSPGYTDTRMLPHKAEVRQKGGLWSPEAVSDRLINWMQQGSEVPSHLLLNCYDQS